MYKRHVNLLKTQMLAFVVVIVGILWTTLCSRFERLQQKLWPQRHKNNWRTTLCSRFERQQRNLRPQRYINDNGMNVMTKTTTRLVCPVKMQERNKKLLFLIQNCRSLTVFDQSLSFHCICCIRCISLHSFLLLKYWFFFDKK